MIKILLYFLFLFFAFLFKVSFLNFWMPWFPLVLIITVWLYLKNPKESRLVFISAYLIGLFIDAQSGLTLGFTGLAFITVGIFIMLVSKYFFSEINSLYILTIGLASPIIFRLAQWLFSDLINLANKNAFQNLSFFFDRKTFLEVFASILSLMIIFWASKQR